MGFTLSGSTARDPASSERIDKREACPEEYSRTHYDRTSGLALKASPRELARSDMLR